MFFLFFTLHGKRNMTCGGKLLRDDRLITRNATLALQHMNGAVLQRFGFIKFVWESYGFGSEVYIVIFTK